MSGHDGKERRGKKQGSERMSHTGSGEKSRTNFLIVFLGPFSSHFLESACEKYHCQV